MRSAELAFLVPALLLAGGCGGGHRSGVSGGTPADENVLPASVSGSLCGVSTMYPNKPCVAVTICAPGTSQCQIVTDILLDTGSFGLRIFRQALGGVALTPVASGAGALATCVQFADGSSDWGPVQLADVVLGKEPTVRVPVHVLDATFSVPPGTCPDPETSPDAAHFNGILGVGVFTQDCGKGCAELRDNGLYFSCSASGCIGAVAPLADQVQNPVALLPLDNNGLIVDFPDVPASGAASAEGSILLGIGTRANNSLPGVTVLPVNPQNGTFTTTLEGRVMSRSFLDTGSNALFFEPPSASVLPECAGQASAFFCPGSTVQLTATNTGDGGSPSSDVTFQVGNFEQMIMAGNRVLPDLAGSSLVGAGFDWGLPFYIGRKVAVGFEERSSPLGQGPFVAY